MKVRDLLILIGIFVFIGWKIFYHPSFPSTANDYLSIYSAKNSSNPVSFSNPCDGRDHCVYIYLAPWCPHCREFLSEITEFRVYWKAMDRPGLKIIVGDDKKDAINEMAATINPPVYLDFSNKFLRAVHLHSFPYIFIVDANQHIIVSGNDDSIDWINKEINSHWKKNN